MVTQHTHDGSGLMVGAATTDITPTKLPAIRNGRHLEQIESTILDPLCAQCIVIASGAESIAMVIVDSCMMPRSVCDAAKVLASEESGIVPDRILISATHTHSAPCVMDYCLGSNCDRDYEVLLIDRIAKVVKDAASKLEPAKMGWNGIQAPNHTHCRRWLIRPEHYTRDPFGEQTVRANMHPGYQNPKYICESGPVDSELSVISFQARESEKLIALLTNFSMHYFGRREGFSSDYFGLFRNELKRKFEEQNPTSSSCVIAMSQGTSGDLHWMDYSKPDRQGYGIEEYSSELADIAFTACKGINKYRSSISLKMLQSELTLGHRLPNSERLQWANQHNKYRGTTQAQTIEEVYAKQAEWLLRHPKEKIILQVIQLGGLAITAIPNEVFGITGLKIKAQSPFSATVNITLANGASGYIPPPEQHYLGGYTTWPARTAGLEVDAEPVVIERLMHMLKKLSSKTQHPPPKDLYNKSQLSAISNAIKENNNQSNRGRN